MKLTFLKLLPLVLLTGSLTLQGAKLAPKAESQPAPTLLAQCAVPFNDNAILQQKIKLPVWGSSLAQAKVTVTFDTQTKSATADENGKWRVVLDPMNAEKLKSVNHSPVGK